MHEWVSCCDESANHQLPTASAFGISQIVSTEECSSLTQSLMQICCSTCSVILYETATQSTCSLNGIYRPHWLGQWSRHCSPCTFQSTLLAARLHHCCTNCSHNINNGWTFTGQTSYVYVLHICIYNILYVHFYNVCVYMMIMSSPHRELSRKVGKRSESIRGRGGKYVQWHGGKNWISFLVNLSSKCRQN